MGNDDPAISHELSTDGVEEPQKDPALNESHGSTLFISNLPYTATTTDLRTLFSDVAPVRSAFVVTEHGTGFSKGVGYVSFSQKEDAQTAFESMSNVELVGRKLRVQWAENKKHHETGENAEIEPDAKQAKQKKARVPTARLPHDPNAIRTVVISGLPSSIDAKVLWKKIRKYNGAENIKWPVKNESNEDDPNIAHVLFSTPARATEAVNKLHAHIFKGSLLSVTLKKRLENLAKPSAVTSQNPNPTAAAPSHASRLIVRNIPFNATEQDIRAVFLPYGPIHSIHIPMDHAADSNQSEDKIRKPRMKGFAFVWMLSKKDAEKAIEGTVGTVLRAGMAQSLATDKQKKKKERRLEAKRLKGDKERGQDEEAEEEGPTTTGRVITVDWALSKDRWKEERAEKEDVEMHSVSESGASEEGSEAEGSTDENIGVHDGEVDESGSEAEEQVNVEEKAKPHLPPPESGTTVFIRNVPFDASDDDLRTLFRAFGPLRYARITKDPDSGRSRGSGFACFWNKADAEKAVRQSELLQVETSGQIPVKKNPFSLPSILTPDPSSSLAQNLVLQGRTLDVVMAVTRDVAGKLKEDNEKARQKTDKRNMHLLKEGAILPNSPEAETITAVEVEKRTKSYNARRALLKSNPSLYISKTRLSVRQIPTFVTERLLKRLAIHAVRAFDKEVRGGLRDALLDVDDEAIGGGGEDMEVDSPKQKPKGFMRGKERLIKQVKIVRQAERVDPVSGKGKSRGYGFVEMEKHSDALRFLRWANNNVEAVDLLSGAWWKEELEGLLKTEKAKEAEKSRDEMRLKRLREEIGRFDDEERKEKRKKNKGTLVVEFSIENVQVVQRRKAKEVEVSLDGSRNKLKRKLDSDVQVEGEGEEEGGDDRSQRKGKRRRAMGEESVAERSEETTPKKLAYQNPMGSIIGRKRKERLKNKKK